MVKKIIWLAVSCLMVISLLVASCGKSDGGETTDIDAQGKPKYGGELTISVNSAPSVWNPGAVTGQSPNGGYTFVQEQILGRDWEKGQAGTGEFNFVGGVPEWGGVGGWLAESFEIAGIGIWVLNIRQGVHFAYYPDSEASELVGGREMTAEDVAYSLEWMRDNPDSAGMASEPALYQGMTVERTGEWQITVNTPVNPTTGYLWLMGGGGVMYVWAKEHLDTYAASNEWYHTVGTGPYIIEDYVEDVAIKYVRNDNYWGVNPCGPGEGDQLPYIEKINWQVIPDRSTRLAAFRTGQVDWLGPMGESLNAEEMDQMLKNNPDTAYAELIIDPMKINGRIDDPNDPYSKLKVRQAMMLAIDHPTIVNDFYNGKAEYIDSPARKWYPSIYTPLEEFSPEVQEYYGYNLEKAKQLMKEAGEEEGFKKTVYFSNTPAAEEASAILKEHLSKINIELELQPLEFGIWMGMFWGGDIQDWIIDAFPGGNGAFFVRYSMGYFRGPNVFNTTHINNPEGSEPTIENYFNEQSKYVMVDYAKADEVTKAAYRYVQEQAVLVTLPAPYGYRIWQPWLKNYYGVGDLKFWLPWAWIDEDLKNDMLN